MDAVPQDGEPMASVGAPTELYVRFPKVKTIRKIRLSAPRNSIGMSKNLNVLGAGSGPVSEMLWMSRQSRA